MSTKKFLISVVVLGVAFNIMDTLLYGMALKSTFAGIASFHSDPSMVVWYIISDFCSALMLTWFFKTFSSSVRSGTQLGMMVGLIIAFPHQLVINMMITGSPYYLGWIFVCIAVITYTIAGTILGMLNKPSAA